MIRKFYIPLIILCSLSSFAQNSKLVPKNVPIKADQQEEIIFTEIESGINDSKVSLISKYFGQQTYFSFSNGINGYYSSNQAFYVLEDFFKVYKVISFKFDYVKMNNANAHATGKYNYALNGQRSSAQVYLSLKKIGPNWIITQFTIN